MNGDSSCFLPPNLASVNSPSNSLPSFQTPKYISSPIAMESNIWLLIVKAILLLLSGHGIFIILCRTARILNHFHRINLRQQQINNNYDQPTVTITGVSSEMPLPTPTPKRKKSQHVEQMSIHDLEQVRLISLAMLAAPLCVNLLQILIIYLDHFQGICLCTAFALIALGGNFKSVRDPTGQLNLVVLVLSQTLFALLFIANKSNFYSGRRKRRYSLEFSKKFEKTFNTYSLKR